MPLVFAGLLVLAALGVALYAVFAVFEARVVSWRKGAALGYLGLGRRSFVVRELKAIAVFCGSNFGGSEVYAEGARALGTALAKSGVTLVYGGTTKGLMGVVADAALAAGGQVHGVITERLHARGHSHERLTRHEIAPTLRLRKQRMAALADAFVTLPGAASARWRNSWRSGRKTSSASSTSPWACSIAAASTSLSSASWIR